MKKAILTAIFIITLIALTGCAQEVQQEQKLSTDKVDLIPDINIDECLAQIKATNPEMSEQAASDNCYSLEAANKENKELCERVSEGFRATCLLQFQ